MYLCLEPYRRWNFDKDPSAPVTCSAWDPLCSKRTSRTFRSLGLRGCYPVARHSRLHYKRIRYCPHQNFEARSHLHRLWLKISVVKYFTIGKMHNWRKKNTLDSGIFYFADFREHHCSIYQDLSLLATMTNVTSRSAALHLSHIIVDDYWNRTFIYMYIGLYFKELRILATSHSICV